MNILRPSLRASWRGGAVVVTLATLSAVVFVPPPARSAEDGKALMEKGDFDGAVKWFLAAVEKNPADAAARAGAAEALLGVGRSLEAIEQAEAGLDLEGHGKDARLWLLLARGYMQRGDTLPAGDDQIPSCYADGAAKASLALRYDPNLHAARAVLARAQRMQDDVPAAQATIEEALKARPDDFDIQFEAGELALTRTRDYNAALAHYRRAAALDPKSATARVREGLTLCYQQRWDEALDAFTAGAKLDINDTQALNYINKYGKAGKVKAVERYRDILKTRPEHAWCHAYLGWTLAYAGDEAGAIKAGKDAMALAPDNAVIHGWYGEILSVLKKDAAALAEFKKVLDRNPSVDMAWNKVLDHATNPGNTTPMAEREQWIQYLTKVRPGDPWIWNNAGLIYRDVSKDYGKALAAYLKASELKWDDQGIVNDTGLIYQFHGKSLGEDPAKCLPYYDRVIQLVQEELQAPEMGYRDTLENLAGYYGPPGGFGAVKPDPELALRYATMRNDPDFLGRLKQDIRVASPRATAVKAWAEKELAKR